MRWASPWLPLVVAGTLFLVSCGKTDAPKASARVEGAAKSVHVARAGLRPMERVITATGTLAAQEQSVLSAKVAGRLQRLAVDLGSVVREGDILAQVEPRDYELLLMQAAASLSEARAALGLDLDSDDDRVDLDQVSAVKQAKAVLFEASGNRDRVKALSQSGIASKSELESAEAAYTVSLAKHEAALQDSRGRLATLAQRRAEHEISRKQLADAAVRAPFDGAVQIRSANPGEYLAVGSPVLTLVKTDPLRLRLDVPERDVIHIREGQSVRLDMEGDTNIYSGRLTRLAPAINEQTRMLRVEADVPMRGALRPGLFARANIIINANEDVLSVPNNAIVTFAGLEKVIVVRENRALEKLIATGRRNGEWVEVLSGLAAEDVVVLNPGGMRTGEKLNPVMADQNSANRAATGSTL